MARKMLRGNLMALLHVNAVGDSWRPRTPDAAGLSDLLLATPVGQPIPILIHGYRYHPGVAGMDPHDQILSPTGLPELGLPSWPRHLGQRPGAPELMIAFGWPAGGTLWSARAKASGAGRALAALVADIRARAPDRPIAILAHSLGARVVYEALHALEPHALWRAVLLFPATFRHETARALASPAGQTCQFVNVTSGENRLFDLAHAFLVWGMLGKPLGRGRAIADGRWRNLPIDCARTLRHLGQLGFPVGPRQRRICHWSSYLRPGLFALYRALIAAPQTLPLSALTPGSHATPDQVTGRSSAPPSRRSASATCPPARAACANCAP